jgi:hypothetical protein
VSRNNTDEAAIGVARMDWKDIGEKIAPLLIGAVQYMQSVGASYLIITRTFTPTSKLEIALTTATTKEHDLKVSMPRRDRLKHGNGPYASVRTA